MWSGRADNASGKERQSRWVGRGGSAGGKERQSRQGEEIVGRCAAATRSVHKNELFLRRAAAAASAGVCVRGSRDRSADAAAPIEGQP
jgi:hypothetical protein